MNRAIFAFLLLSLGFRPALGGDTQTKAIVGVNVLTMVSDTIRADQTILIRDGLIIEVGDAASTEVPGDAIRIDGSGRYLMPGLADMCPSSNKWN